MKKCITLLLLCISILASAQNNNPYPNPMPSSGTIRLFIVGMWMDSAGEFDYESGGLTHNISLADLNSKSHLADKTLPFKLTDWYGYQREVYSFSAAKSNTNGLNYCTLPLNTTVYATTGTLQVGTQLYADTGLTTPITGGYLYAPAMNQYYVISTAGVIFSAHNCN